MRTGAELDQMHEATVARFPGGCTPAQYRQVVLESADDDGRLYPHTLGDYFAQQSALMGMLIDGLICRRCKMEETGPWYITEKGRKFLCG